MKKFREFTFLVFGCMIGSGIVFVPLGFYSYEDSSRKAVVRDKTIDIVRLNQTVKTKSLYEETLSQILFDKVKILCMVMTQPDNHRTRADHVRDTWGKRCNKLIFMSSKVDPKLDTVVLPFEESRAILWKKTRASFQYAYEHHADEFDFFLKADDDK